MNISIKARDAESVFVMWDALSPSGVCPSYNLHTERAEDEPELMTSAHPRPVKNIPSLFSQATFIVVFMEPVQFHYTNNKNKNNELLPFIFFINNNNNNNNKYVFLVLLNFKH